MGAFYFLRGFKHRFGVMMERLNANPETPTLQVQRAPICGKLDALHRDEREKEKPKLILMD